jgi:Ser/Thr protein kinase RdoA (MazF antagonist)
VKKIASLYIMVCPWVAGTTLLPGSISPEHARQIGALLGQMHALRLPIPGLELPTWRVFRDDDWVLLARRAVEQRVPWAEEVRAALRELRWWSRLARDANPRLWNTLVVSHRDLEPGNVIWRDTQAPAIIDWESAGLINPTLEVVEAALNWSGPRVASPDEATFKALIAGYRRAGGTLQESIHDALAGVLGRWLEWLEFNMRRSLDGSAASIEEEDLAWSEVYGTLRVLQRLGEEMGQFAAWLEG